MAEQSGSGNRNERLGTVLVENGLDDEVARNILACPELAKCAVEAIKRALDVKARQDADASRQGTGNTDAFPFQDTYFW